MYKGFKFRIYPNDEQIVLIEKTFGCCRLVYNDALVRRKKAYICIEDLNVKGMIEQIKDTDKRNVEKHNIQRAYSDAGLGQFINILTYKAEETGRILVKIGRYIPSSQTCHCCGHRNPAVKDLSIREWVCPNCGEILQRDYNAAINILTEGIKTI